MRLDTVDYKSKTQQLLIDGSYHKLRRDPTKSIERRVQGELEAFEELGESPQQQRLKLAPSFTQPPRLYGLSKIHKDRVPCHLIVLSFGSPTYVLAKEMTGILSPLAASSKSYVKTQSILL